MDGPRGGAVSSTCVARDASRASCKVDGGAIIKMALPDERTPSDRPQERMLASVEATLSSDFTSESDSELSDGRGKQFFERRSHNHLHMNDNHQHQHQHHHHNNNNNEEYDEDVDDNDFSFDEVGELVDADDADNVLESQEQAEYLGDHDEAVPEFPLLEQEQATGARRKAKAARPAPKSPKRQALVVCDDEADIMDIVAKASEGVTGPVDDVLIIEGCTDDDDDAKFQRRIQHDKDVEIIWDVMTMAELQAHAGHIVSFFVPPVVYLPAMLLVRLFVLWPLFFAMRVASFARKVAVRVWPMLVNLCGSALFFPQRLAVSVLLHAELLARRGRAYLQRTSDRLHHMGDALKDLGVLIVERVKLAFVRKRQRRRRHHLQRAIKRTLARLWRSVTDGLQALGRLVYLVFLPVRVAYHALLSFAWASSSTLGTIVSIPVRVGAFVVNSPFLFGRSAKRAVRFVKDNRQDVLDVIIALTFLVVLGMVISGLFLPLLRNVLQGMALFAQHVSNMMGRLRLPRLRIPRLNVAKLREVLPFRFPKLPVPDFGLLLGLRERTFWEKVAYVFSD
ncbi:Hypothetical Protein FCC1311_043302 [Hondaea fermentalgiana]|uniref:Uncharacterized protein n=1 Tax=Hondaea fermentalgiana TaxID=2315210 RepID=A0A2R5GAS2_9STRA|nr:Hypothetical Protein FCC1311_043302 [Hondaea fermentalgiana]|eukprot:GBG28107.1 Hypothetical Protein FCC1311_043302 [Hondaea fermentalgiana]